LLEILGQAQNPAVIQTHLKKLFAGIHSVDFSEDSKKIVTMKSLQGEVVPLSNPVFVTDQVEGLCCVVVLCALCALWCCVRCGTVHCGAHCIVVFSSSRIIFKFG
jgi:Dynein heavy chain, N-terminal region 2